MFLIGCSKELFILIFEIYNLLCAIVLVYTTSDRQSVDILSIKHQLPIGYKYFVRRYYGIGRSDHQGLEELILRILVKSSISVFMLAWLPILYPLATVATASCL